MGKRLDEHIRRTQGTKPKGGRLGVEKRHWRGLGRGPGWKWRQVHVSNKRFKTVSSVSITENLRIRLHWSEILSSLEKTILSPRFKNKVNCLFSLQGFKTIKEFYYENHTVSVELIWNSGLFTTVRFLFPFSKNVNSPCSLQSFYMFQSSVLNHVRCPFTSTKTFGSLEQSIDSSTFKTRWTIHFPWNCLQLVEPNQQKQEAKTITWDTESRNTLTVSRGQVGGHEGLRNGYEGHEGKTKGRQVKAGKWAWLGLWEGSGRGSGDRRTWTTEKNLKTGFPNSMLNTRGLFLT